MPNPSREMSVDEKLNNIIERLERIEQRQVKTTAMVSEVKEHEAPVVGSFATTEIPPDEEK